MRRLLLLCAVLLLAGVSSLTAQPQFHVTPTVGANITRSPNAFKRFYSTSPEFGLGVEYRIRSNLSVHARVHYTRLFLDADGISRFINRRTRTSYSDIAINGPAGHIWGGTLNLGIRSQLPKGLVFHGLFGIGLYRHSLYDVTVADNSTPTTCPKDCFTVEALNMTSPGLTLGFRLSTSLFPRYTPFLEPGYVLIFSGEDSADRLPSENGSVGYFPIRFGLSIRI